MASEIRVDKINSLSGVGTVTLSPTGVDIAGITTAATLRATTGIVTSLTAGSLTSLGAVSGTTGTFSAAVSGTTGTFSGAVSGTTGTFTGDLTIPDKIVHTGDTDTAIRLGVDTVTVETAGSERVRIASNGRFGVGTNNPTSQVDIHCGSDNTALQITSTDAGAFASYYDNTGASSIGHQGTDLVLSADPAGSVGSSKISFQVDSNNVRATIDSTGDLTISDGDLVIGTSGHGIDFSSNTENESGAGSSSGQLLDDYEEGTWTPVFDAPDQSSTTFVHHRQHGYYTKIGNLVHVTCYIQGYADANTAGGSNDGIVIDGLPFTVADLPGGGNTRHAASFAVGSRYRLLVDDLVIHAYGAQTVAKLWVPSNGNTMDQMKSNQMTARGGTNEVYFAGSFRVHA